MQHLNAAAHDTGQSERDIVEKIGAEIIDSALFVHKSMGPGLLESIYHDCHFAELKHRGFKVEKEVYIPLKFRNYSFDRGLCIDLLVEDKIIIEIKSVERLLSVHRAQMLSYMKLADKELGFLINYNVPLLKDGIVRLANYKNFVQ